MTPKQKQHAAKADRLIEKGSRILDAVKKGISPVAAELLTEANKERQKAGLIKGKLDV